MNRKWKGRLILLSLVFMFALPALLAKTVLVNHWYQSGVTNKGQLIEPSVSYQSLGLVNPLLNQSWQLAYVVPEQCDDFCHRQLYLLRQSHVALGKYQQRVTPVVLMTPHSDNRVLGDYDFNPIEVSQAFVEQISEFEVVIVDPLGTLVMRYPKVGNASELAVQSKDLLADLRKLLKLSRVG